MIDRYFLSLGGMLALAAIAVVLTVVLTAFHRTYRRDYLRLWAWSWRAMAVGYVASAASLLLVSKLPASHPARLSLTAVSLAAAYWHALWLLQGTRDVSAREPAKKGSSRKWMLALAALAVLSTLLFAWDPTAVTARYLLRVGLKSLLVGGSFIVAGIWVLSGSRRLRGMGRRLVGWGFVLFGVEQLQYAVIGALGPFNETVTRYSAILTFVDLLLPPIIGIGLVAWLLEEEHDHVVSATRKLEHMALHDPVTDLPNRALLLDRLSQALATADRHGGAVVVAAISLKEFRKINQEVGFRGGDELLRNVGMRLASRLRPGDTLARTGADEYCAALSGLSEGQAVTEVERLLLGLGRPIRVFEQELEISASAGVAVSPRHGRTASELLHNATRAQATAKRDWLDRVTVFDPELDAELAERTRLEAALPGAMATGQLVLCYQPIVRVGTGEVVAFEALLRWRHPEAGMLFPSTFLSCVESAGLDLDVTEWVLRTALMEFSELQREHRADLRLAVNLSPHVFQHPAFPTMAATALAESSFKPGLLSLEITESAAMHDADAALAAFREIKRLGMGIALDDFGTGYSSLSYLRYFPVDTLKIDQSFVRRLNSGAGDSAVVDSILSLARTLQLQVTAEGVEREDQARWLAAHGCDLMQGFLVAPGLTLDECRDLLAGGIPNNRRPADPPGTGRPETPSAPSTQ